MAEPAKRRDPVYGDEDSRPVTRPDLRAQEGIGQNATSAKPGGATSGATSGTSGSSSSSSAGSGGGGGGSYNSTGNSPARIKNAEESPGKSNDDRIGEGYNYGNSSSTGKSQSQFRVTKKRALIAGGVLGGGAGGFALLTFLLLPLKIENLVQNVENRFFSSSNEAVGDETDNMLENFMKSQLGPAMKRGDCAKDGRYILSKDCSINVTGSSTNPVVNLYKTWSQAKLEDTLADKYGIELRYDTSGSGTYYLKAPGISGEDKVGDGVSGIDSDFDRVDRGTVRTAFKSAESDATSWGKVMIRYKYGGLMEEKYGIKRCIVYCGKRDALANSVSNKKYAAKLFLVERVITPRSAAVGSVVGCLINQSCDQKQSTTTCTESTCNEMAGAPQTEADAGAEQAVGTVSAGFGSETASKLVGTISDIRDAGGTQNYVVSKVLESVGLDDIADNAGGVVGWLNGAAGIISSLKHIGPDSKKLSYIVNSGAAVSLFMMYRTYADEIHTGHVDATEVGSFTNALGPGSQCASALEGSCGTQVGGTASAEQTPLYNSVIGGNPSSSSATVSLLNDILPSTAYAASGSNSNAYKCDNGKPVPSGSLVCPEEKLGAGNPTAISISNFLNGGVVGLMTTAIAAFHNIVSVFGSAFSGLVGALMSALGVGLPSFVSNTISPFFHSLINDVIPNPFANEDQSGGRTGDGIIAGGDVAGNDYAHTGLGGQMMTPAETASIVNQQQTAAQQQFAHESFFARMFSTDSQYSLISRLALDIPSSPQYSFETSFASFVSSPFSALTQSFGSIFSSKASAATPAQPDPFGITQYGYPNGVPSDPQTYWKDHCSDDPAQAYQNNADYNSSGGGQGWNGEAASTTDPNTGMPENTTVNACLLIEATVGSAGGTFNSGLLTSDDVADLNSSGSGAAGSSTNCTTATGDAKILCEAEQYNGIYYLGGGGHGFTAFQQACSDSVLASAASTSTAADPGPCATDCSGLVSVAASEAFGQNFDWNVAAIENDTTDWQKIVISSVQPGDVVTQGANTHVEIVDHYDGSGSTIYTFGSHTTGQQTSQLSWPVSSWTGAYHYIGPGASS